MSTRIADQTARYIDPAAWWRTAPNPPCVSWCEERHAPEEFNQHGSFLCCKTIRQTPDFEVDVQAFTGINGAETDYRPDPATVWVDLRAVPNEMTPAHARAFSQALALAISEAATVADRTVRA